MGIQSAHLRAFGSGELTILVAQDIWDIKLQCSRSNDLRSVALANNKGADQPANSTIKFLNFRMPENCCNLP